MGNLCGKAPGAATFKVYKPVFDIKEHKGIPSEDTV